MVMLKWEDSGMAPSHTVHTLDPLTDPRWSAFVERHPAASVFHSRGWLRALQLTYGYEPLAVTTAGPTEPLTNALLFCLVRSWLTGDRMVSLPFSDHCEPLVSHRREFMDLATSLDDMRTIVGCRYVEMRSANTLLPFDRAFTRSTSYCLHKLDLRPGLDVLYRGFHKDCIQRKIRRAEKERLSYEVGVDESLIDRLFRLMELTRTRHRVPTQPIEWFRNLVACLGSDIRIRIASKAGNPVAGIVTLSGGKHLVYKYGASDAAWNHLGGMGMLFWEAIKEAKQSGLESLDLGRSDGDNAGLIAFKERWAAERTELTAWRSHSAVGSAQHGHLIMRYAKSAFGWLPRPIQTFAGRLLYRHAG
jgi:CelD/BcsL family acetyltransferase involved in cellulose biosynthesis